MVVGDSRLTDRGVFGTRHALKKSQALRDRRDTWLLKLPLMGTMMYKSAVARFARTLSTTLPPACHWLKSGLGGWRRHAAVVFKRPVCVSGCFHRHAAEFLNAHHRHFSQHGRAIVRD